MIDPKKKIKSEWRKWLKSLPFVIRADLVKRDNTNGYSLDKFLQDMRKIDFETNLHFLGRKRFGYVRKAKNESERIFGLVSVEGRRKDSVARDIHFHILFYIPSFLDQKANEVRAYLHGQLLAKGYDCLVEIISNKDSSVDYNTKENQEADPTQEIYFTHQAA